MKNKSLSQQMRAYEPRNDVYGLEVTTNWADQVEILEKKLKKVQEALKHWDMHQGIWDAQQILGDS